MLAEVANRAALLTYEEAADALGLQLNTIKHPVYREVLHPIRVSGNTHKYVLRAEIEWYDRRRSRSGAVDELNPYLEARQVKQYDAALDSLGKLAGSETTPVPASIPPDLGGLAALFLVFLILLALLAKKEPDPQQLEQLWTAPELKGVRRAILRLAGEIAT